MGAWLEALKLGWRAYRLAFKHYRANPTEAFGQRIVVLRSVNRARSYEGRAIKGRENNE